MTEDIYFLGIDGCRSSAECLVCADLAAVQQSERLISWSTRDRSTDLTCSDDEHR